MMLSLVDAQQSRLGASQRSLCNCSAKSDWGTRARVRDGERRLVYAKRWPLVSEPESRLHESNAEQNKLKGTSLFLSLSFLLSLPTATPHPLHLQYPPLPAPPNTPSLFESLADDGALAPERSHWQGSGTRAARRWQTEGNPTRLPPLVPQRASTVVSMCKHCACSAGLNAHRWLLIVLLYLWNNSDALRIVKTFCLPSGHYRNGIVQTSENESVAAQTITKRLECCRKWANCRQLCKFVISSNELKRVFVMVAQLQQTF